jgi:penicillin-binding protein 1A
MVAAHQGVEVKELAGVGMGTKLPQPQGSAATVAANGAPKVLEIKPGPPPVLTRRGADVLVQVEKMLDDLAKTAGNNTAPTDPKPARSTSLAFPEDFAAAPGDPTAVARKN